MGKLNIAEGEIAMRHQLMAVRPIYTVQGYFKFFLMSRYNYFQSKGTAISKISSSNVIEPIILLPPLREQKAIVDFVNDLHIKITCLKSRLQSAWQTHKPKTH